jgi:hypothetical protein
MAVKQNQEENIFKQTRKAGKFCTVTYYGKKWIYWDEGFRAFTLNQRTSSGLWNMNLTTALRFDTLCGYLQFFVTSISNLGLNCRPQFMTSKLKP